MRRPVKLRRSFHYVPGSYPQLLQNASALPADVLCFDLEDSVAGSAKQEARAQVIHACLSQDFGPREVVVRVNGFDTPWGEADASAIAPLAIDGILLPKVESAEMIRRAADVLQKANASSRLGLWCQIETPRGVLRAEEIATAHPRVVGFVIGGADLVESMHARDTPERLPLLGALSHTVLVARAYDLAVIDAIHPNFQNDDGLEESCRQSVDLGFDGKSVALPRQLPMVNAAFGPSLEALARAKRTIDAASADGVTGYETLHLAHARRVVALAAAIEARDRLTG